METKYGSIGRNSAAVAVVAADGELDPLFGRHVLPAANVAHRPQHLLEAGELRLDLARCAGAGRPPAKGRS